MKTYKQLLSELHNIQPIHNDTNKSDTISEMNKNLHLSLDASFQHVSEALIKVKKTLSMYGIQLPQLDINEGSSGSTSVVVSKFDSSGENHKNVTAPGEEKANKLKFSFSYKLTDGHYNCRASITKA
jgi:hypothetical protein